MKLAALAYILCGSCADFPGFAELSGNLKLGFAQCCSAMAFKLA
jgi:hypothetical protein